MPLITRTAPTFTTVEAPVFLATDTMGTVRTLDLTTKQGADVIVQIGRRVVTVLGRSALVAIRRTNNNTMVLPETRYDVLSQTAVCVAPTVATTARAIGDINFTVSSNTGLAIGDILCFSDSATGVLRYELNRITLIAGTTITMGRPFRVAHNVGDIVTNLADIQTMRIPGGDIYEIRCLNSSGFGLVFAVDAIVDNGDTST